MQVKNPLTSEKKKFPDINTFPAALQHMNCLELYNV
jgi:hypothetical protein